MPGDIVSHVAQTSVGEAGGIGCAPILGHFELDDTVIARHVAERDDPLRSGNHFFGDLFRLESVGRNPRLFDTANDEGMHGSDAQKSGRFGMGFDPPLLGPGVEEGFGHLGPARVVIAKEQDRIHKFIVSDFRDAASF